MIADRRFRVLQVWVAVVLLAGGVYATYRLFDEDRGAATPEEAGAQLVEALNGADLVGVIDLLPDGERDVLLDLTVDLGAEGERLDLFDDGFRLDGLPGIDVRITDPTFDVEPLGDGLARVALVDGEASYELDGDRLTRALGDVVVLDDTDGDIDFADQAERDEELADELDGELVRAWSVVVVEDDGRWFPSLGFTVVEALRAGTAILGDGPEPPDLDDGVEPDGGRDPVDAVQDLLDGAATGDLEDVLEVVDPGELGALQVYAEALFGELGGGDELGIHVELTDADVESLGGGADRVVPTGLVAEIDLGPDIASLTIDDGCVALALRAVEGDLEDVEAEVCDDEDLEDLPEDLGEGFEDLEVPDELVELLDAFEPERFGFVTVERDGEHYVSPIRTVLDLAGAVLGGLDPDDLEGGGIVRRILTGGLGGVLGDFFGELDARLDEQYEETFPGDDGDDGDGGPGVPVRTPTGASGPSGALLAGDVVEGDLPGGEVLTFTVVATAGEGYVGAQATGDADLTITVSDAVTGEELDYSDDFVGTDPEAFVRTTEGQVLSVEVAGYGESDAGGFVVYYEV